MAADASGFSDPYAIVYFEEHRRKTERKEQTLNPVWKEHFEFKVRPLSALAAPRLAATPRNAYTCGGERHWLHGARGRLPSCVCVRAMRACV